MLVKILGAIDFIGGLILIFISGFILPIQVLIFLGIIFFVKSGMGFLKNFASWIDFLSGIIFILLIFFPVYWIICIIIGILLIQKGIFSFL
jgi:cell shape-determining protein MreD